MFSLQEQAQAEHDRLYQEWQDAVMCGTTTPQEIADSYFEEEK